MTRITLLTTSVLAVLSLGSLTAFAAADATCPDLRGNWTCVDLAQPSFLQDSFDLSPTQFFNQGTGVTSYNLDGQSLPADGSVYYPAGAGRSSIQLQCQGDTLLRTQINIMEAGQAPVYSESKYFYTDDQGNLVIQGTKSTQQPYGNYTQEAINVSCTR